MQNSSRCANPLRHRSTCRTPPTVLIKSPSFVALPTLAVPRPVMLACTGDSELGDLDQSAYDEKLERLVALSSGLLHDLSADYSAADATDSP
jgi:hypothetical protein